jgi:hypothetical protein
VKDPSLESGFDPVLDRIQYLAENSLTSLMVLHDFLSRRPAPLQDRLARPAWMYTRVNDILLLERGPGSSLDEALLAACLKALTADQFSGDLVLLAAVCEPICANKAARTALLATMPTLDDVNIAPVQRGDQSRGVGIPGAGVLAGAADGHGQGSGPAGGCGGVPTSGGPAGGRGGVLAGGPAPAPGKGKQARVVLDDDDVSSDEDEPLQKRLRRLFDAAGQSGRGPAPVAPDAAPAADKEATDKKATEKAAADKEAADKSTADEGGGRRSCWGLAGPRPGALLTGRD